MNKLLILLTAFVLTACESKPRTIVYQENDYYCSMDSADSRAKFILQCIENANPKSDEEPEDWIRLCQKMAESTLCPEITVTVTKHKRGGSSFWDEVSRVRKQAD